MVGKPNILIVGGGIGGLSLAIGLGRVGIHADLVEVKKSWAVYGVGIIQPGNALRAYKALGLADRCLEHGYVYKRQRYYASDFRKFTAATSWSPEVSPRDGVKRLITWLGEEGARVRSNGETTMRGEVS